MSTERFAAVTASLARSGSGNAIKVWSILNLSEERRQGYEDYGWAWGTRDRLAKECGMSRNTFVDAVNELVELGYLTKTSGRQHYTNRYQTKSSRTPDRGPDPEDRNPEGQNMTYCETEPDPEGQEMTPCADSGNPEGQNMTASRSKFDRSEGQNLGHDYRETTRDIDGGVSDTVVSPTAADENSPPENIDDERPPAPPRLKDRTRCRQHQDWDVPPPCGDCKEARIAEDARIRAKAADDVAKTKADQAASLLDIRHCRMCDDDGYLNGRVCHHVPDQAEINTRGAAAVRAAIRGDDLPAASEPSNAEEQVTP